ncbi:MAG: hypothetical protein ACFB2Z_03730 [Maricaulaceae bacterium]
MTPRVLTVGEIREARTCFTNHLNYSAVRIFDRPWWPLQPAKTAMAPNGNVYFHPEDFLLDFSVTKRDMSWLIHELTHCWQKQVGQKVILQGAFHRQYKYGILTTKRPFRSYKIEQEAAIVEDYYLISNSLPPRNGRGTLATYQAVIPMLTPK